MIDHLSTYATDFEATRAFYVATLPTLGFDLISESQWDDDPDLPGRRACAFGPGQDRILWVIEVREAYTPRHLAFEAPDRKAVDAFHAAGIAAGARDHGAPGPRPIYHEHYYGSFLLDPDGNNVEAVCHRPAG